MKIHSYIFSYNREKLLLDCARQLSTVGSVTVVDDHSDFITTLHTLRSPQHLGKKGFHKHWQVAFNHASTTDADWFVFAQDDFGDWDTKALIDAMRFTEDGVLHYHRDDRESVWVNYPPKRLNNLYRQIGWVDAHFAISNKTLRKVFNYRMPNVPDRWLNLNASSGVGKYITEHLQRHHVPIIQPYKSICDHMGNDCSMMHHDERKKFPLNSIK